MQHFMRYCRNWKSVLTPRVAGSGPGSSAADCPQLQEFSRSIDSTAVPPHSPSSSLSLVLLFISCCIISAELCSINIGRKTPVTHHPYTSTVKDDGRTCVSWTQLLPCFLTNCNFSNINKFVVDHSDTLRVKTSTYLFPKGTGRS